MFLAPVAAPGGNRGTPPEHKVCRGERMGMDSRKNLKFSLNVFQIFIKIFLKSFKNFLKAFKIFT